MMYAVNITDIKRVMKVIKPFTKRLPTQRDTIDCIT